MKLPAVHASLQKFSLYETALRFYLVGSNESQTRFKILKIDKMPEMVEEHADPPTLNCVSDSGEYSASQIREVLGYISDSVEKLGGITLLHKAYGIFGFIRFLQGYYLILITNRRLVANIGPHKIYECVETTMVPLFQKRKQRFFSKDLEKRYRELFRSFKIGKNFYFSHTYNLTHTLQYHMQVAAVWMA